MATARGLVYGSGRAITGGVRRLSSRASQAVGRPSPSVWSDKTVQQPAGKKSGVTRVMQRDPARGTSLPLADRITDSHIDLHGNPGAQILSRNRTAPPGAGQKRVKDQSANRSLDKR